MNALPNERMAVEVSSPVVLKTEPHAVIPISNPSFQRKLESRASLARTSSPHLLRFQLSLE
jgi:hypothetical protein